jgi:GNAT superfamily N-acetyltransferase
MKIVYLADHPEAIGVLAGWFANEWGNLDPRFTVAGFSAQLAPPASRDQLPISLVGLIDGEPVATASLKFREIEYAEAADYWLGWVFVREDMRGRGYCRTIVAAAEAEAATRRLTPLFLHTPGKAAMYVRFGWQAVGETVADGVQTTVMTKAVEPEQAPSGARDSRD